jgi:hypothetical protein
MVRRVIAIAFTAAGLLAGMGTAANAGPPDPDPNHHAVDAACDNVPSQAQVPFC